MAYQIIERNDPFGRVGKAIGQGLSEQIPKEMEHKRLRTGLQELADLADKGNLSPAQFLARAAGTYGATPQITQSFGELAKQMQQRRAYQPAAPKGEELSQQTAQPSIKDIKFAQKPGQIERAAPIERNQVVPSGLSREEEAARNQPAAAQHPLSPEFIPAAPWGLQDQEQAINEAFESGKAQTLGEAQAYANQKRELYEQAPEKYRQQLEYRKGIDQEVDTLYDKELQTRLQKEGKETFADIPGDLQLNIKKEAKNAVALGRKTPQQAAEYYSKRSLDLAKSRNQAIALSQRDLFDRLAPYKKEETVKNLINIGKDFAEMGSSENYFNLLKEKFGLTNGGAAVIAYKRSPKVKELINKSKVSPFRSNQDTLKFTDALSEVLAPTDSLRAIARVMRQKEPEFDEYAYWDYFRNNKEKFGFSPQMQREINEGTSDLLPNWGDVALFPAFTKSVANE